MSSPVKISFSQLIQLDRRKDDPLYLQIAYQLIRAIKNGLIESGQKIPGSRFLSKELDVHRKTIVAALEELKTQGWLESVPSVGMFVKNPEASNDANSPVPSVHGEHEKPISFKKNFILSSENNKNSFPYNFTDGTADYRIIKPAELGTFYTAALKRKSFVQKIPLLEAGGNQYFRQQLSFYLNLTHNLHISSYNLLTADHHQVLLYILTQMLISTGDTVLVAEYNYPFSNMVFQQAGARLHPIPMDNEGISVDYIRKHFAPNSIRAIHLSPQNQYPTTISMTERRIKDLLQLTAEYNFLIIEDDSDFELNYERGHQPLIKQATAGNVIYIGGFGRFLPPGFRSEYIISTQEFIAEAGNYLNLLGRMDAIKGQALGEMIFCGDIHRYRRKAIHTYRQRRDLFADLLRQYFSEKEISFDIPTGGLAFWIRFHQNINISRLADYCQKSGLYIPKVCQYQSHRIAALRLGFSDLSEEEMEKTIRVFYEGYRTMLR